MMKVCVICGKRPVIGRTLTHRGMLKKKGGVGRRTVRSNLRRFLPNLQRATILLDGVRTRSRVCTTCLKSGRVQKAPSRPSRRSP
ncbi:MAG: 50S ribosomal protein L28 [Candidatus Omnitrophica bacterium]|nr:50S ribosomal protein L28 [Candidatus Omnitrophota bacterium]